MEAVFRELDFGHVVVLSKSSCLSGGECEIIINRRFASHFLSNFHRSFFRKLGVDALSLYSWNVGI